jgi:two-component system LytT family response regulator
MSLTAVIVDDESLARENLRMMLEEFCPEIEVIGMAGGVQQAREMIDAMQPQVVFLDIRMPSGAEGFELLDSIEQKNFLVVFVTAFKDYAVKAFNANAIHYILKPIDIDDLMAAVKKIVSTHQQFAANPENYGDYIHLLRDLTQSISNKTYSNKVTISHTKGMKIVEDDTILYLEADGNCTCIYFTDKTRYLDTRTMKVYEEMLNPKKFYRIHKSFIININHLKEYLSEDGHFAVMKNGMQIPVARNRVSMFITMLKSL